MGLKNAVTVLCMLCLGKCAKRQPARILEGPQDTKTICGEDIVLFCKATGNPDPQVTFHLNGVEVGESSEVQGLVVRSVGQNALTLRMKVQMTNDGDVLTCQVHNHFGMDSAKATITVYDANEPPPKGLPKILENPTTTMGQIGDATHLQCDVSATPPASIVWIKDNFFPLDLTQPRLRIIGTGSLVIDSLLEEDSGIYECMARNIVGTAISNAGHLHVRRIEFPPTIHDMVEQVYVSPGKGTNLTCRASGYPIPMVWWATQGTSVVALGLRDMVGSPVQTERSLTEPHSQQATLRLTDITDHSTYICIAKNTLGVVRRNISIVVKPLPDPPAWLDVRPIGGNYAVLRWKSEKAGEIESYTLTVESKDNNLGSLGQRQVTNIHVSEHPIEENNQRFVSYNLTDLSPYTTYTARVQAVNKKVGLSPPSDPIEFRTAEIPPGMPPQDLRLQVTGRTTLQITWSPPLKANGKILGYKVYYTTRRGYPISARQVKRSANQKIHLHDLIANATYIISVSAYNAAGDGPISDDVSVLITPGVPGQPRNFRGFAIEVDSIQLMWSPPEVPEGHLLMEYGLWYSVSNTPLELDSKDGTEVREQQKQEMSGPAPASPSSAPSGEQMRTIKADATQFVLRDLKPGMLYHLRLAGRTANGYGASAVVDVRTQEHLPHSPRGKDITVLDPQTIRVTWLAPEKRLSEVRHFKVSWSPALATGEGTNQGSSHNVLVNPADPLQLYTATIGALQPNIAYKVSVAAVNSRGLGKAYEYPIVVTRPDAPLRPLNLRVIRMKEQARRFPLPLDDIRRETGLPYVSLELAWDRPPQYPQEGQLVYQVSATPVSLPYIATESQRLDSHHSAPSANAAHNAVWINGTRILANVTKESFTSTEGDDLGFGITYLFQVAVVNGSSTGATTSLNVTTPENVPSGFPLNFKVRGVSPTAVEVTWEPPALHLRNGRLTSYQVRYFEVGAETETEKSVDVLVPEQLSYTARDLKTQTYYSFMVRAFTSRGPGPWTRANNVRTTVESPPPPVDIQAIRINQHQIKVTWRMPDGDHATGTGASPRVPKRRVAVQGFRLLYAPNESPYDSDRWTTYDVGPVEMTIISHLDSKSPYIIRVKSRGPDGRFGEWSPAVVARSALSTWETEFSVRDLLCSAGQTSAKITWQRPQKTSQLVGFNLRISGSKEFADESGVMRRQSFEPRSAKVAFFVAHDGYSYVVEELEPNTVYDVQINAYYEKTLNLESNWETTSCHTAMQKPAKVPPPLPISALEDRKQVNLKVFRVSERLGKIRQYYLLVSPYHLTDGSMETVTIEETIATSRGLPSSKTRYIAARFTQDYFEPPGTSSRDFILGGSGNGRSLVPNQSGLSLPQLLQRQRRESNDLYPLPLNQHVVAAATSSQQRGDFHPSWLSDDNGLPLLSNPVGPGSALSTSVLAAGSDQASAALGFLADEAIVFDNKPLEAGQVYCALVLVCVFNEDQSVADSFTTCTASPWSPPFATDPYLPALLEVRSSNGKMGSITEGKLDSSHVGPSDLYTVSIVAVILGVAVVTTICTILVCVLRRRRQPKMLTRPIQLDQSLKQPLMNVSDGAGTSQAAAAAAAAAAVEASTVTGFYPVGTICANNGALSVSPPGYSQLVSMPKTANSSGYCGQQMDGTNSFRQYRQEAGGDALPSEFHYRYDSSGLSGPGGLFSQPKPVDVETRDLIDGVLPNANATISRSLYPSPQWREPGQLTLMNGNLSRMNGIGYNTCNGRFNTALATAGENGLFSEPPDDNSMELQQLFCGGTLNRRPIPAAYLAEHIRKLSADDNRLLSQEYESIDPGHQFSWETSNLEVNKSKNRYANVVAYDHSRVILRSIEGIPGSDYINANYIDGYKKPNCYIATQGPLPETYSDFWRMIWEQRVSIIVMMTRLEERARIKCDQYWPSRGPETYAGGLISVLPKEVTELAYYTIRKFSIRSRSGGGGGSGSGLEDEVREVVHLQFTHWPDHGVPESPIPLLLFMRRIRAVTSAKARESSVPGSLLGSGATSTSNESDANSGPIVVHCSAGVGRTGALIALDIMHDQMKYENAVDVLGCVTSLRAQRNFMVQTEEQYVFVYAALLEMAEGGYTEVSARGLYAQFTSLLQTDSMGFSGFDLEFKKLESFFLPKASFTSALLPQNKCKNRFFGVLPYEMTRVSLTPIRGIEGSDYINANFIDSYRKRQAYIATQGPMAETLEDFWRMIWEHNSAIIVMLSKPMEQGKEHSYPYWPSKRSARYQYYVIDPMVEYNMPTYTLREFKVTDTRAGVSRTVRQFQYTEWPEMGMPDNCEAFTNFITQIHKTKDQFGQDGPITVHCSCGSGRTGVFVLLSIVLERLRNEGLVDILQTVRLLRTQRIHMIQSPEQLQFCYKAVLDYISSFNACVR